MPRRHLRRPSSRTRGQLHPHLDITGLEVTGIRSDRDITGIRVTGLGGLMPARIGWDHAITVIAITPATGAVNRSPLNAVLSPET